MKTFEDLGIAPDILRAITEMGFVHPMPVQEEVIPVMLSDQRDIIALAQTGTGKTAAFGLPVIQKVDLDLRQPQTIILSPTRELCLQIAGDLNDYTEYVSGMRILPVYGGSSIQSQIKALRRGVHVIVATPGRLIDLLNRKQVSLENVRNVVLDEADEMLQMGFTDSIDEILSHVPDERSMLLFSATMPQGIARITKKYMHEPMEITIGRRNEAAQNVKHSSYLVNAKDKYLALKRIVDYHPNIYGIVFCRTRRETQEIADNLMKDGYDADSLHGDLSQSQRDDVMNKFRQRNLQILVATDVAARGLDVDDITHVINYGLPDDFEVYTHRSGRTGRVGKTGSSIAIIHTREQGKVRQIEKMINRKFEALELPAGDAICEKQLFNFVDQIEKVKVNEEEIERLLPSIFKRLDWLEKQDIIKRVVSLEFNRLIDYYQEAEEIVQPKPGRGGEVREQRSRKQRGNQESRRAERGYTRFFINIGTNDGANPANLMGFINDYVPGKVQMGRIDLLKSFSFFEVPERNAKQVLNSFRNVVVDERKINVEVAEEKPSTNRRGSYEDSGRMFTGGGQKKRRPGGRGAGRHQRRKSRRG